MKRLRSSPFQAALLRFCSKLDLTVLVVFIRKRLRTIFLTSEMFSGAWSLQTVLASSFRVTSSTQWSLFSITINKGALSRLVQAGLITFDHQQVIRLPGNDLRGNRTLAAHRIDTDEKAFQVQGIKQFGNGRDLVALCAYFLLAQHQAQLGRKSADHVNGRFASAAITTHGFAVDREGAAQLRNETAHPAAETTFKLLRVEQTEDAQKGVFRSGAVLEHKKLAQPSIRSRDQAATSSIVSQSESTAEIVITNNSRKSCRVPLLGWRGSSTSLNISIKVIPLVIFGAAQKTRVDGISHFLHSLAIIH